MASKTADTVRLRLLSGADAYIDDETGTTFERQGRSQEVPANVAEALLDHSFLTFERASDESVKAERAADEAEASRLKAQARIEARVRASEEAAAAARREFAKYGEAGPPVPKAEAGQTLEPGAEAPDDAPAEADGAPHGSDGASAPSSSAPESPPADRIGER